MYMCVCICICICVYTHTFPSNIIFIYAKLNFPNKKSFRAVIYIFLNPHDSQFTIIKSLVYIFPPKASAFTILSKVQISLN